MRVWRSSRSEASRDKCWLQTVDVNPLQSSPNTDVKMALMAAFNGKRTNVEGSQRRLWKHVTLDKNHGPTSQPLEQSGRTLAVMSRL